MGFVFLAYARPGLSFFLYKSCQNSVMGYNSDYAMDPETKSKIPGIILAALGLLLCIFIFTATISLLDDGLDPNEFCYEIRDSIPITSFNEYVGSEKEAGALLGNYLKTDQLTYKGTELANCGVGYSFKSTTYAFSANNGETAYILCENGNLFTKDSNCQN